MDPRIDLTGKGPIIPCNVDENVTAIQTTQPTYCRGDVKDVLAALTRYPGCISEMKNVEIRPPKTTTKITKH